MWEMPAELFSLLNVESPDLGFPVLPSNIPFMQVTGIPDQVMRQTKLNHCFTVAASIRTGVLQEIIQPHELAIRPDRVRV